MVQSAPVSVTKKAIQSKAEQFSTCMYVLCMCMYLFACERVLLAGVDVGWLCWARLVFYLLVFYLLVWTYWTCWRSTCWCGRGLAVLGKVGVDLLVFYLLDLLDLLDLLVSYLLVWTWAGCAGRGCFR